MSLIRVARIGAAEKGQSRPKCGAAKCRLFDHFVGGGEQSLWHRKPQCFGGFQSAPAPEDRLLSRPSGCDRHRRLVSCDNLAQAQQCPIKVTMAYPNATKNSAEFRAPILVLCNNARSSSNHCKKLIRSNRVIMTRTFG